MNHSSYLDLPPRSLRDMAGEVEQQISDISDRLVIAAAADAAGNIARMEAQLGHLLDRLDEIKEELAWAERGEDARERVGL